MNDTMTSCGGIMQYRIEDTPALLKKVHLFVG